MEQVLRSELWQSRVQEPNAAAGGWPSILRLPFSMGMCSILTEKTNYFRNVVAIKVTSGIGSALPAASKFAGKDSPNPPWYSEKVHEQSTSIAEYQPHQKTRHSRLTIPRTWPLT
jgi:hypothetical protein